MEKGKEIKFIVLAAVFALVLAGASVLYNNLKDSVALGGLAVAPGVTEPAQPEVVEEEATAAETQAALQAAPDFTVTDLEGNPVKLSDFRGKPTILNFWASWCGPCVSEMPEFQSFYDTYGEEVNFVLVNLTDGYQETVESASKFIADSGYTFPVYYDTNLSEAAYTYGVNAVPVSYFLDAEGNFVAWAQGAMSADMLQQGVDMILE